MTPARTSRRGVVPRAVRWKTRSHIARAAYLTEWSLYCKASDVRDVSVSRALEQISEIHGHLARTHVYRGWRPVPCALSGAIGMAGVVWQLAAEPPATAWAFVIAWSIVAAVAIVVGCAEIAWHYTRASVSERHRARHVFAQAVPAVVAAIIITVVLINTSPALVTLLPGVWALMFGVGLFAARPFVPQRQRLGRALLLARRHCRAERASGGTDAVAVGRGRRCSASARLLAALVLWKEREATRQ